MSPANSGKPAPVRKAAAARRKPAVKRRPQTDRQRLEALRDRLEKVISDPATTPRDAVGASRELRQILVTLAAMPSAAAGPKSPIDQIAERRRRRGA